MKTKINLTRYKRTKYFVYLHHKLKIWNKKLIKKTINIEFD